MPKLLLIAFEPFEAVSGAGLAQALGLSYDVLALAGLPETDLGADRILNANLSELPPADGLAGGVLSLAQGYSHIGAIASMQSKDVLARLAGLLDAAMVTDVLSVVSQTEFTRPIVAGSVI